MNIRTILFAASLCLLSLSPLQATTPTLDAVATIETKVIEQKTETPITATPEAPKEATSEKAVPAEMNSNVTMSVGTIIIILLLVIILL